MITRLRTEVSRRQFLVAGGFAVAAACLIPRGTVRPGGRARPRGTRPAGV